VFHPFLPAPTAKLWYNDRLFRHEATGATCNQSNEGAKMPITNLEARTIKDIVNSYLTEEDAKEMFDELIEDVADITDNDSVKQSLLMLGELYHSY
jgi:hypothetical protein